MSINLRFHVVVTLRINMSFDFNPSSFVLLNFILFKLEPNSSNNQPVLLFTYSGKQLTLTVS